MLETEGIEVARREIEKVHAAWLAAEIENRIDYLLALCTDQVEMQPPVGNIIRGRLAVGEFLRSSAAEIEQIDISDLRIEVAPSLAVKRARFSTKLADGAEPVTGTHLWLLRPAWQVTFVMWSLDRMPS